MNLKLTRYPGGGPFHWQFELGEVKKAVQAYLKHLYVIEGSIQPTAEQISAIQEYLEYWINAPCWDANPYADDEGKATLSELRQRVKSLGSVEGIRRWCEEASEFGLEPI